METDSFLTIKNASQGIYKVRGSKFLSFAFPVTSEEEIKTILDTLRKQHHDAKHHCYAWRLGSNMNHYRVNDDGEPSNSAGNPILGQIKSKGLTNVLLVVVRYFGGTLLGVSGLINAYKIAAAEALTKAELVTKYEYNSYSLSFRYEDMDKVMKVIKEMNLNQWDQDFGFNCSLKLRVRKSEDNLLKGSFRQDSLVKLQLIKES